MSGENARPSLPVGGGPGGGTGPLAAWGTDTSSPRGARPSSDQVGAASTGSRRAVGVEHVGGHLDGGAVVECGGAGAHRSDSGREPEEAGRRAEPAGPDEAGRGPS